MHRQNLPRSRQPSGWCAVRRVLIQLVRADLICLPSKNAVNRAGRQKSVNSCRERPPCSSDRTCWPDGSGDVIGLATLATALGGAMWQPDSSLQVARLGIAVASANAQPVIKVTQPRATKVGQAAATEPTFNSETLLDSGDASYYGAEIAGDPTAGGDRFDPNQLTAAHRSLPLGSRVRVTNSRNAESVVVRINDRGPFHSDRIIDLSNAAARTIGLLRSGTGQVSLALLIN